MVALAVRAPRSRVATVA